MPHRRTADLHSILALDERVDQARSALQRTSEAHPAFERRVKRLIALVRERDKALSPRAR